MFGNLLGWSISAVLAMMMGLFVWFIDQGSVTTPPTTMGLDPGFVLPLSAPFSPAAIVPTSGTCPQNHYHRAIEQYLAAPATFTPLLRATRPEDLSSIPAIQSILDAAECRIAGIFIDRPGEIVNYDNDHPQLGALRDLGHLLVRQALLNKSNAELARRYYRGAFTLGATLFAERLTYAELSLGVDLMSRAAVGMKALAQAEGDQGRVEQLEGFQKKLADFARETLLPRWQIVSAIDQRLVERHAGDVFFLARQSQERMWRVEAMLKLGRYRFNAGRAADQRAAGRVVARYAEQESDPVVRLAAQAATELTLQQYHRLH